MMMLFLFARNNDDGWGGWIGSEQNLAFGDNR